MQISSVKNNLNKIYMNIDRDYIREKYKKNVEKKTYLERPIVSGFDGCFGVTTVDQKCVQTYTFI
jgi:hypothetical protein